MYTIGVREIFDMVDLAGDKNGHQNLVPVEKLAELPEGTLSLVKYEDDDFLDRRFGVAIRCGEVVEEYAVTQDSDGMRLPLCRRTNTTTGNGLNLNDNDLRRVSDMVQDYCNEAIDRRKV